MIQLTGQGLQHDKVYSKSWFNVVQDRAEKKLFSRNEIFFRAHIIGKVYHILSKDDA